MTEVEPIAVPVEDARERAVARRTPQAVASAWSGWIAALIIGLGVAAAIYFYQRPASESPTPPPPGTSREALPRAALPEDAIRHPLPEALVQSVPQEPLPPLDRSDAALQEALVALAGPVSARDLFHPDEIARRVVVTVDNLPRRKLPAQLLPVKPAAGSLVTSPDKGGLAVAAANDARYAAYAAMMTAVDTKKLVAAYVHFYPLFQEEYRTLGYPYGAFNDRVIEAIDDLLAAPEIDGPVGLVQPKVVYEFADPGLESLSAGQKLMVRIGPRDERAAKAWLRDIRKQLTSGSAGR